MDVTEIMAWLSKRGPSIAIAVAGLLGTWGTWVATNRNDKAQDTLTELSKLNKEIGLKTGKLAALGNEIGENNAKLVNQNIDLTNKANEVIGKVDTLTNTTHALLVKVDEKSDDDRMRSAISGHIELDFYEKLLDNDLVFIQFGEMNMGNPVAAWNAGASFYKRGDFVPMKINVEKNKLLISLVLFDLKGNFIVEFDKNYWHRNPNFTGQFNYDKRGFEVIDNQRNVAFNINIIDSRNIRVQGNFVFENETQVFIVGRKEINHMPLSSGNLHSAIVKAQVEKLFKYTGEKWFGMRIEPPSKK